MHIPNDHKFVMKSTRSRKTIIELNVIFSRNGVPEQLVSDNGPQFTFDEFNLFMKRNGIKHIRSAAYHQATNRLAERFLQTFKQVFRSAREDEGTIEEK